MNTFETIQNQLWFIASTLQRHTLEERLGKQCSAAKKGPWWQQFLPLLWVWTLRTGGITFAFKHTTRHMTWTGHLEYNRIGCCGYSRPPPLMRDGFFLSCQTICLLCSVSTHTVESLKELPLPFGYKNKVGCKYWPEELPPYVLPCSCSPVAGLSNV